MKAMSRLLQTALTIIGTSIVLVFKTNLHQTNNCFQSADYFSDLRTTTTTTTTRQSSSLLSRNFPVGVQEDVALLDEPSWTKRDYPKPYFYNLTLQKNDFVYQFGGYETGPIVVPEYKLVFFSIPKVGCTEFKQLFRRMMRIQDWKAGNNHSILHPPRVNGLWYLYNFSPRDANTILTDPSWTRAIFVRDPRRRLLSAYLDKVVRNNGKYVRDNCCKSQAVKQNAELSRKIGCGGGDSGGDGRPLTLYEFLHDLIPVCDNDHWRPQRLRLEEKYWPYINFVGHLESASDDVQRLLRTVGHATWEQFGASGWGNGMKNNSSNDYEQDGIAMFGSKHRAGHATNSSAKGSLLDSPGVKAAIDNLYQLDYDCPLFGLPKPSDYGHSEQQTE